MGVLKGLKPERVFYYFEKICSIPHGSGNTKQISDFCVNFANKTGLECYQDKINNIIIKKPAAKGYENKNTVIIQGHLDMVCEKNEGVEFDFSKDALKLSVCGDLISADGTTLGADDGIAVAFALAILEDKTLKHPPIEALFTVDEETGMFGAKAIDEKKLNGKMLINIDSENEGVLTVGCAGGARADIMLKLEKDKPQEQLTKITINGLLGGHSGVEINKGRLNANVLMGKFLSELDDFALYYIAGGKKDNVIPSFCEAVISAKQDISKLAEEFVSKNVTDTDSGLKITVADYPEKAAYCYSKKSSELCAKLICNLPNGIIKMSNDVEGLVQTSLNLGVMETIEDSLFLSFAVRSSINSEKIELLKRVESVAEKFGAVYKDHSHYPAWEYKKGSYLRENFVKTYKEIFGKEPIIEIIHAGLECGLFSEKIKGLDAVSLGPDMFDIHSGKEKLSVSSSERCYKYLLKVLENL